MKDIVIKVQDLKSLQFLIINAQCFFATKREYTEVDKKTMDFASDLLNEITKSRLE